MSASEAAVQASARVRGSELGLRLWRNNVGVAEAPEGGRPVRYGLANDSHQMQKRLKSSDLVGWGRRDVIVNAVGGRMGAASVATASLAVFVSFECKRSDWFGGYPCALNRSKFNDREEAQAKWIDMVRADGGIAGFIRCNDEMEALLRGEPNKYAHTGER